MFTGIITDLGRVRGISAGASTRFDITTGYDLATVAIGASIACAGTCLTVVEKYDDYFTVDVSNETLAHTTLGAWTVGQPINLERPLRAGDELGGHIVSGHVDAVARIVDRYDEGDSVRFAFEVPEGYEHAIAPKGSVALDGETALIGACGHNGIQGAAYVVSPPTITPSA